MKRVGNSRSGEKDARERMTRLSTAMLRISASHDLDTDPAGDCGQRPGPDRRPLRRHRLTIDEAGEPAGLRHLRSHRRRIPSTGTRWPDGPRLFEHLRELPGALRVPDLAAYVRSLGLSPDLGPLRDPPGHADAPSGRGTWATSSWPASRARQTFADEEEEILVLFASQAASAIANARAYGGRATGPRRPRGAGRDLTGGRRGLRCPVRPPDVAQSRGQANRGEPAHAGPSDRGPARGDHLPPRRRTRDRARSLPDLRGS